MMVYVCVCKLYIIVPRMTEQILLIEVLQLSFLIFPRYGNRSLGGYCSVMSGSCNAT